MTTPRPIEGFAFVPDQLRLTIQYNGQPVGTLMFVASGRPRPDVLASFLNVLNGKGEDSCFVGIFNGLEVTILYRAATDEGDDIINLGNLRFDNENIAAEFLACVDIGVSA